MSKIASATMLTPAYLERFSCIGGDCEDTCCAGWTVNLDQETYQRYQVCFDPELRPLFTQYMKRNSEAKPGAYGTMGLGGDPERNCGCLSTKKLCRIQERMGEEALSDICWTYPRRVVSFGELHQMTLLLSCPEAARLALLDKDAFGFQAKELSYRSGYTTDIPSKFGIPLPAMDDFRTLMIQVLRTEGLTLPERMRVVGAFCERLTDWIEHEPADALPGLIHGLEAELDSGDALACLQGMEERTTLQAQFSVFFLVIRKNLYQTPHQRRVLEEVVRGMGLPETGSIDHAAMIQAYKLGLARLAPALNALPWLLEHFLLNEALGELFPWSGESPRSSYSLLLIRFCLVRMLLVGRAASREAPLTPAELAETVQVFCRLYHAQEGLKAVHAFLAEGGWDRLEKLYTLL